MLWQHSLKNNVKPYGKPAYRGEPITQIINNEPNLEFINHFRLHKATM